MPRCKGCGSLIHSGRYCDVCGKDDALESYNPDTGPDPVECYNCDGKAYVDGPDGKEDCPVCDGVGLLTAVADGGLDRFSMRADVERFERRAKNADSESERRYWTRHADQLRVGIEEVER